MLVEARDAVASSRPRSGVVQTEPAVFTSVGVVCRSRLYLARLSYVAAAIDAFLQIAPKWTLESACEARAPSRILDRLQVQEGIVDARFREARFRHGVYQATNMADLRTLSWWLTHYYHPPIDQKIFDLVFYGAVRSSSLDLLVWLVEQKVSLPLPDQNSAPLACFAPVVASWLHKCGYRIHIIPFEEVKKGNVAFLQWARENADEIQSIEMCLKIALNGNHLELADWLVTSFPNVEWSEWDKWSKFESTDVGKLNLETIKWVEANFVWKQQNTYNRHQGDWFDEEYQPPREKWIAHCIKQAADDGKIEIVQYLYDHPLLKSKCRVVRGAAVNGHFKLVKWLHHQDPNCAMDALTYAAREGHLNIVRWIHGQLRKTVKLPLDGSPGPAPRIWQHYHKDLLSIDEAAASGSLELVKWLHKNRKQECSDDAMSRAAYRSHIDIVQWLQNNREEYCSEETFHKCAEFGRLEMLKLFHENEYEFDIDTFTMDWAAEAGHLEVVKWLHENRTEGCTTMAVDAAARNGYLDVVKYLLTNRTEGCTTEAMDSAAGNGRLEIVSWLHENRQEGCTQKAIDSAATSGHLAVVKFLYQQRKLSCSKTALDKAYQHNHFSVLAWLLQNDPEHANYDPSQVFHPEFGFYR